MSELPGGSGVPQRGAAEGDAPQPKVSSAARAEPGSASGPGAPAMASARRLADTPESRSRTRFLRELCMGSAAFSGTEREADTFPVDWGRPQPLFGEEMPRAHGGRFRGLDEPNWVFMDACRAREAARDARWQARYPNVYLDYFTFIEDLFASVALSRLAAELGCDRLKDRE